MKPPRLRLKAKQNTRLREVPYLGLILSPNSLDRLRSFNCNTEQLTAYNTTLLDSRILAQYYAKLNSARAYLLVRRGHVST